MKLTKDKMDILKERVWNKAFSDVVYANNQNLHQFASDFADDVIVNEDNAEQHMRDLDLLF